MRPRLPQGLRQDAGQGAQGRGVSPVSGVSTEDGWGQGARGRIDGVILFMYDMSSCHMVVVNKNYGVTEFDTKCHGDFRS